MITWTFYVLAALNAAWGAYQATRGKHDVANYFLAWAILFFLLVKP